MKCFSPFVVCTFFLTQFVVAQDTIVRSGDTWRYHAGNYVADLEWTKHEVSGDDWQSGTTPFGNQRKKINTLIDCHSESDITGVIGYFSTTFFIDDPYDKLAYEIRLRRDDGAIVYINGHEFWRSNVSDDEALEEVIAIEPIHVEEGEEFTIKIFPPEDFRDGMNTIGVALFTWGNEGVNCAFDLEVVEHNELAAIPKLLRFLDEETILLESKLQAMAWQEQINELYTENALLGQDYRFTKIFLFIALGLFVMVIVMLFLLYTKHKKQITELKEKINEGRQEALNNSFYNLKNSLRLEEFRSKLKALAENKEVTVNDIKKIVKRIEQTTDGEQEWSHMEAQFNLVNSGYLTRLKESYPTLSRTELRHCIFIKLHVPTKELADLMNIEPRSVQATRYRIKKKLDLPEEVDLRDFLTKF